MPQPNILEYLPVVFAEIKEMIAHANAEKPEIENLWAASNGAYNDQFLYQLTENGAKRWEAMLKIQPLGTDSIEDRRFRIINRLNSQLPYTFRMLEFKLNQMCGEGGYTMTYTAETYTLRVRVSLTRRSQLDEIKRVITDMIPVNVVLDYDLQYNSHGILSAFTHGALSDYTHGELKTTPFE